MFNSNPGKFLAGLAHRMATAAYRETQEKTMTNAIEQSKREMYDALSALRAYSGAKVIMELFESRLESYLELLRQDQEALHETARKRFEDIQSLEAVNKDLIEQLSSMTEKRDALRNLRQASNYQNSEAPEIALKMLSLPATDTDSGKGKIDACMDAIERWSDIQAAADRGALLDIIKILNGGRD